MTLPPEPFLPPITASFRRRVRDYCAPLHRGPRRTLRLSASIARTAPDRRCMEAARLGLEVSARGLRERQANQVLLRLREESRYFLFPLQLSGRLSDPQPFAVSRHACGGGLCDREFCTACAGRRAPADQGASVRHIAVQLARISSRRAGRDWGSTAASISSTVAISKQLLRTPPAWSASTARRRPSRSPPARPCARSARRSTRLPGLTFPRHLDEFWTDPIPPEPGLYGAFRRVLVDRCLVRGGVASESAVRP